MRRSGPPGRLCLKRSDSGQGTKEYPAEKRRRWGKNGTHSSKALGDSGGSNSSE